MRLSLGQEARSPASVEGETAPTSYLELYGLAKPPFGPDADPVPFQAFRSHRPVYEALTAALRQGSGHMLVLGDAGVGKTTMLAAALQSLPDGQRRIFQVDHDCPGALTLPRVIGKILNIPEPDILSKEQLAEASRRLWHDGNASEVPILAIDDAQYLAADSLDWLGKLVAAAQPQVILAGRPGFATVLSQKQYKPLSDRLATTMQLGPLAPGEARQYIERRLWLSGSSSRRLMTGSAVRGVIRAANGSPGHIDVLLDNALAAGYLRGETPLTNRTIQSVAKRYARRRPSVNRNDQMLVAIATIVLAVGIAAFTYRAVTGMPPEPPSHATR